jgi:TPR repeat protein
MLHLKGNGVVVNTEEAANWIEKAAHNDHAASQFQLGVMYCMGQGVPRDLPKAVAWYELAAKLGHPHAQYNLAIMLSKGQGCEPDRNKALLWLQTAAEQGLAVAQIALREFESSEQKTLLEDGSLGGGLGRRPDIHNAVGVSR